MDTLIEVRERNLSDVRVDILASIALYNKAMGEKDLTASIKETENLVELEREYATKKLIAVLDALKTQENPILAAIVKRDYEIDSHKDSKNDVGIVIREYAEKVRQIDILDVCRHCSLSADWVPFVQKFNMLLCARCAEQLGLNPKVVSDSYYMADIARDIDMGKTPTSNTQILKQLQTVIDKILLIPNENGENVIKAISCDATYLTMLYQKRGKAALSIATSKDSALRGLIVDTMHKIIEKKSYSVEYKQK